MRLKTLISCIFLFAVAQGKSYVKTQIKLSDAKCVKKDKEGICLIYSIRPSDNLSYSVSLKSKGLEGKKKYTLLVLASHVGFMDPIQISLIKNVSGENLKQGLKLKSAVDTKKLPISNCADFRNRILLAPFVLNKELSEKEIEDMLKASRYCPDPKNKEVCSYNAFYAYVQKTGMVLNDINREFVTICKEK